MKKSKFDLLMCIFCWIGAAMVAYLEAYMFTLSKKFPEIESFRHNFFLILPLLALWLLASLWFTVIAWKGKKKK